MNEQQLAQSIFNNLKESSKRESFISLVLKPERQFPNNYNIVELKKQANILGFNIFELNEIKSKNYKNEKGETLIATFYDSNDL